MQRGAGGLRSFGKLSRPGRLGQHKADFGKRLSSNSSARHRSPARMRVITNLMQVVGVDSYGHELPLAGLLQDAMALPLIAGGNIGVRRRQLHALMLDPAYDDLATLDGIC
jgi:hypothetical protein